MAPRVCPDCDELMDTAYEDGAGGLRRRHRRSIDLP